MKILVTSGGTKVPIDMVRNISNMSTGNFGSKIATQLLKLDQDVIFLRAEGSKSPMSLTVDYINNVDMGDLEKLRYLYTKYYRNYAEYQYKTFNDYAKQLASIITSESPDIVVLAAAVSDYGVSNYVDGKVRSQDKLNIKLIPLPKLINNIKKWSPNIKLVGFKLLVNSTDKELITAAKKSIDENQCDMVIANDLRDIKNNNHRVYLVYPNKDPEVYESSLLYEPSSKNKTWLPQIIADHIIKL